MSHILVIAYPPAGRKARVDSARASVLRSLWCRTSALRFIFVVPYKKRAELLSGFQLRYFVIFAKKGLIQFRPSSCDIDFASRFPPGCFGTLLFVCLYISNEGTPHNLGNLIGDVETSLLLSHYALHSRLHLRLHCHSVKI